MAGRHPFKDPGTLELSLRRKNKKEQRKRQKYDTACRAVGWSFGAPAMGTRGVVDLEGARILQRILKRAAFWLDGDLRASGRRSSVVPLAYLLLDKSGASWTSKIVSAETNPEYTQTLCTTLTGYHPTEAWQGGGPDPPDKFVS